MPEITRNSESIEALLAMQRRIEQQHAAARAALEAQPAIQAQAVVRATAVDQQAKAKKG